MATTRTALAVLLLSSLATTGCATLRNGRHQDVLVRSEPAGAAIRLNGADVGSTPATVRMRRRGPAVLEVQKAGFAAVTVPVPHSRSRAIYGNLVFANPLAAQGMDSMSQWAAAAAGWLIGTMSLDWWSGGAFKRPPVVEVTLVPAVAPGATASGAPRTPPDYSPPAAPPDRRWKR